jgi:hypothetical protein
MFLVSQTGGLLIQNCEGAKLGFAKTQFSLKDYKRNSMSSRSRNLKITKRVLESKSTIFLL